jgi:hypothetical protein
MRAPLQWADRQLPAAGEVFLDHVGYFTADLAAAGAQLQRLGFSVSPVNLQQNADARGELRPSGTSNRLAILRRGFLEVLAATHDTPLAEQLRAALARHSGLQLIALSHADIPAQRERLITEGFAMQEIVHLRRHKETPEGLREVRWSVLRPEPGAMPEGRVQFAYCHTPDLTWPEPMPALANAADGITDILLCVPDRQEAAQRFARFVGRQTHEDCGLSLVPLDRGSLAFVDAGEASKIPGLAPRALPFMAGQAVRCLDLDAARATLRRAGMTPAFDDDGLVCVGSADALGSLLLFHASHFAFPWCELAARATRR